jgi:hypothetical protein
MGREGGWHLHFSVVKRAYNVLAAAFVLHAQQRATLSAVDQAQTARAPRQFQRHIDPTLANHLKIAIKIGGVPVA